MKHTATGGRWRRVAASAIVLPVTMAVAASSVITGSAVTMGNGGWSGIWSSTTASGPAATLAEVRQIINASTGAAASLTGAGVGVALIDTGVAPVPGLPAAKIVNGPDLSFESQAANLRYLDTYGHGTHMAGIIVGNDTATGTKGLAPGVKLTSIKVGSANGAVDVSQMIAAIDWVVAHRNDDPANPIKVINLSYGTGGNPLPWTDPVQYAVEQAWKNGIVVVAAAGNAGGTKLTDPATDQYIIAVGAQSTNGTVTNADDDLTTFTNLDPQRPIDLLAPGVSIVSLRDPGSNIDNAYPTARVGENLFRGSGTSQAAAVTSAAAALLLQYKPTLTPDKVKYYLQQSRTWPTKPGKAQQYGLGFLNVNAAIAKMAAVPNPNAQTWSNSSGLGTLEAARGTSHVLWNNVTLSGEKTIFGPWSSATWAPKSAARTAWVGGVWMGNRFAGDGWTGTSWASKTWASATWSGKPWDGSASWVDPNWTGRFWSGRFWSAGTWNARFWSSDEWSSAMWG